VILLKIQGLLRATQNPQSCEKKKNCKELTITGSIKWQTFCPSHLLTFAKRFSQGGNSEMHFKKKKKKTEGNSAWS